MRAAMVVPAAQGGRIEIRDVPMPMPGPGEILVRVRATALNRGEVTIRRAHRAGEPKPCGVEFAGEVVARGDGAALAVGARVMGHCVAGACAEYVAVDERLCAAIPGDLSWHEAAAVPNVYMTAHDALVTNGRFVQGERVLVTAASSGIGMATAQIACGLGAGLVIGTTRSAAKAERLRAFGFSAVVNLPDRDVKATVAELTDGKGVDVVIDSVGAAMLADNMACLALRGRLVQIGRMGGKDAAIDLDLLALKRLHLIGVTFRTRTMDERVACFRNCMRDVAPHLAAGAIRPAIDRVFGLDELEAAQAFMERNEHVGKIVVEVSR